MVDAFTAGVDVALDGALGRRRGVGRCRCGRGQTGLRFPSSCGSPGPGRLEASLPQIAVAPARRLLLRHIVQRVTSIGQRPPLGHHPTPQIDRSRATHGDDATVAIDVARMALQRLIADSRAEGGCGGAAAVPGSAGSAGALLGELRGIDSEQSHTTLADGHCVAVDDDSRAAEPRVDRPWTPADLAAGRFGRGAGAHGEFQGEGGRQCRQSPWGSRAAAGFVQLSPTSLDQVARRWSRGTQDQVPDRVRAAGGRPDPPSRHRWPRAWPVPSPGTCRPCSRP